MKILITGASGYVGARLYKDLQKLGFLVQGTYNKRQLFPELIESDMTDEKEVKALFSKTHPDSVIHAAALSNTSMCLTNPEYAYKLNVQATRFIVNEAKLHATRVIFISTFACYNDHGDSVYYKTKCEAENIVNSLSTSVIIRLSMVVGLSPNTSTKTFFNELLAAYKSNSSFEADASWEFEMTYLGTLVDMLSILIKTVDIKGEIIPCFEQGVTSKYRIASDILPDDKQLFKLVSGRSIPLPDIDLQQLNRLKLPLGKYEIAMDKIKTELNSL